MDFGTVYLTGLLEGRYQALGPSNNGAGKIDRSARGIYSRVDEVARDGDFLLYLDDPLLEPLDSFGPNVIFRVARSIGEPGAQRLTGPPAPPVSSQGWPRFG